MSRDKILALVIAGFGVGVLVRSFWVLIPGISYLFIFLGALFVAFFFLLRTWRSNLQVEVRPLLLLTMAVFLIAFGFGILRYDIKDQARVSDQIEPFIETRVFLQGVIVDEADERENSTRLVFRVDKVFDWDIKEWMYVSGDRVLLTAQRYPEFSYGDLVKIRGILKEPEDFTEDFSWRSYLAKDDIFLQMFYPEITRIESGHGSLLKSALFGIKQKYLESVSRILPEPHASFLGGLTVGARRSMPQELLDDFRKVGLIHIVVLSGYNVTIIARSIAIFFTAFLSQTLSIIVGIIGIAFFAILTGGSATVVRASIMASLAYLATATGRVYEVTIGLFFAGFLMLLHNPKILRFDVSFQLSFVATLGLIFLAPRLEKYVWWLPKKFKIREYGLATLSAQLAVTPLILHTMGNLSIVALPVNLFVLIAVPITMFFGFVAGALGLLHAALAIPFGWIAYALLAYELKITELFADIPFVEVTFSYFPAVFVLLIYGLMILFIVKSKNAKLSQKGIF